MYMPIRHSHYTWFVPLLGDCLLNKSISLPADCQGSHVALCLRQLQRKNCLHFPLFMAALNGKQQTAFLQPMHNTCSVCLVTPHIFSFVFMVLKLQWIHLVNSISFFLHMYFCGMEIVGCLFCELQHFSFNVLVVFQGALYFSSADILNLCPYKRK